MRDPAISGKTILITGGTGSFGSTVTRVLLASEPAKVVIFSRDEKKQYDMRNAYRDPRLEFHIGDVRDPGSVDRAMHGVDLVFHAAALKQVPTGEFFPIELVRTNILGSANVMEAAIDHEASRVVILSTDKAVYPINVMGMTKALMEKTMIANARLARNGTVLCGVRYGNVMYSRGSVIPLFVNQVAAGQPLTVTNRKMTRFMMPLSDCVELVRYALAHGAQGDLFVRKSPATTIETVAEAVQTIFARPGTIEEIGVRGGEKMHEVLVSAEELARAEDRGAYFRILPESRDIDYERYFTKGKLRLIERGGYASDSTEQLSLEQTVALLRALPELQPALAANAGAHRASVVLAYA
ncbi:MAG: polysaccharide biosynthesis protein [bacterium]|nr:polysaccharide biosynthesis protein [bacterium]